MLDHFLILLIASTVVGAAVGSFLNVVIYRLPRGMSVAVPSRSFCPGCETSIPWYRNIPLLTWIFQNGRCASCGCAISVRYVLVEALTALLFAVTLVISEPSMDTAPWYWMAEVVFRWILISLTVSIAVIDLRHAIIPDPLTIPWIPVFVIGTFLVPGLLPTARLDSSAMLGPWTSLSGALAGVAVGCYPALFIDFIRRKRQVVEKDEVPQSALPTEDESFSFFEEVWELRWTVVVPAAVAAAVGVFLIGVLPHSPAMARVWVSLSGVGTGLFFIYGIRALFSTLFRREAMGLGDAKYLALVGAVLGSEGVLSVFLLGCVLGAIPAFIGLFRRIPVPTFLLLTAAFLPFFLLHTLVAKLGPTGALILSVSLPLIALVLFLRRLRRTQVPATAMPFGPFLATAALLEVMGAEPLFWVQELIASLAP